MQNKLTVSQIISLKQNEDIMHKVFPQFKEYPPNALVPVIGEHEKPHNPVSVNFLVKANKERAKSFKSCLLAEEDTVFVGLRTEDGSNSSGQDLIIKLDFVCGDESHAFEVNTPGSHPGLQKQLIDALAAVDELVVFISDLKGRLICVKMIEWNPVDYEPVTAPLLGKIME